ncbi:GntR family transcriptional regulator [Amycolatopsis sp. GM8]|uniref:GntR family transcriptional regulator n=1 Tax=Amycolatopsis sp. GM8 TaxID=2896530 RepID=UPI001F379B7B|nr:GntR family transcriptional regulator [Amycolatopsis sp. GM8]
MSRTAAARWTVVYENLRGRILTLELAPGVSLTESLVAKELEVSPTPVRDALGRLCQDGLVEVVKGRGYRVAPLTVADIAEICDLRFVIESGVLRLACERIETTDLEPLRELSRLTGDATVGARELIRRNQDFHVAIARLAGGRRTADALERVMDDSTRIFHLGLTTFSSVGMQPTHDAIITAIETHNYTQALEHCREECFGTNERVLTQLLRTRGTTMLTGTLTP